MEGVLAAATAPSCSRGSSPGPSPPELWCRGQARPPPGSWGLSMGSRKPSPGDGWLGGRGMLRALGGGSASAGVPQRSWCWGARRRRWLRSPIYGAGEEQMGRGLGCWGALGPWLPPRQAQAPCFWLQGSSGAPGPGGPPGTPVSTERRVRSQSRGQRRVSWLGAGAAWPERCWDPSPAGKGFGQPRRRLGPTPLDPGARG